MKRNKIVLLVMAIVMVFTMPMSAGAKSFKDVSSSSHSWAIEAIESMADDGIIAGYNDGTFKPDNTVTKLESLVLTARVLGVNSSENAALVEAANLKYAETVDTHNISFGTNEVCYLLYKNVIFEDELADYISKANASLGMKRYEIAVLLTKAMGAEDTVSKNLITSLDFSDADEIPAYAKKYVEFVCNEGVMKGMGDNKFSPNTNVTRAQMALLMKTIKDTNNYTFTSGTVQNIDYSSREIKIKTPDETVRYVLSSDILLRLDGIEITANDVAAGYEASVTLKDDKLYAIDFSAPSIEKEVNGVLTSKITGNKNSITFYVIEDTDSTLNTDKKETYLLSEDAVVTYEDSSAKLADISTGAYLRVSIKDGKVVALKAYSKDKTIQGVVSNVEIVPVCKLYIAQKDGMEDGYVIDSQVTVTRNGKKATADKVLAGDTVNITLTYGRITKIIATSKTTEKNGVIKEVIISASPKITVKTDGGEITYPVTNACEIVMTGKASPNFYDLRVGEPVSLTLEGETVVKLITGATDGVMQLNGTVISVNASYNLVQINYTDLTSGVSVTEPVFIKSKTTIIDITTGNSIKLTGITNGSKITAFGVRNNGVFEATAINVSK